MKYNNEIKMQIKSDLNFNLKKLEWIDGQTDGLLNSTIMVLF